MSIDEKTVRKVAKLARLALPEDRVKPMADELNGIMAWIEQLNEVDVEGVEPMTSAVEGLSLPMREDVVTAGDDPEKVLKNASSFMRSSFSSSSTMSTWPSTLRAPAIAKGRRSQNDSSVASPFGAIDRIWPGGSFQTLR